MRRRALRLQLPALFEIYASLGSLERRVECDSFFEIRDRLGTGVHRRQRHRRAREEVDRPEAFGMRHGRLVRAALHPHLLVPEGGQRARREPRVKDAESALQGSISLVLRRSPFVARGVVGADGAAGQSQLQQGVRLHE